MGLIRKMVGRLVGCWHCKVTEVDQGRFDIDDEVNHNDFHGDTIGLSNGVAESEVIVLDESDSDTIIWYSGESSFDATDTPSDVGWGDVSGILHESEIQINNHKEELVTLRRQVDVCEMELRVLRKQISQETKKRRDMSKQAAGLKKERDAFEDEWKKLKVFLGNRVDARNKSSYEADEQEQKLSYEKYMNANLRLRLQKTQESNAELMRVVKELEQKNKELSNLSNKSRSCDAKTLVLEQKIIDLSNEIEIYKQDKYNLRMQIEELGFEYEILKIKNHEQQLEMEELRAQQHLYEGFGADLRAATAARVAQEQRAILAEESTWKIAEDLEQVATQGTRIAGREKRIIGRRIKKSQRRHSALPIIPETAARTL